MKRSKIFVAMICSILFLNQSLTCSAIEKPKHLSPPARLETENSEQKANQPSQEVNRPERQPFLDHWHTSIPDNSTPERYGLSGDSWDAYALASDLMEPYKITLFGNFPNTVTITDVNHDLYQAELLEKTLLLDGEIKLTSQLNELMLVSANGGHFPRTKANGQLFTGTMRILPYNGVIHHIMISEEYTVKEGDTISQIILDCGWLPEGRSLYGENGYLEQYAAEQKFDLSTTLTPGQVVRWHSEDIQIVDNLYPDIEINIIPGHFFSGGQPATFDQLPEAPEIVDSIPIFSDLVRFTE